jgi:hypothetical protein
MTYIFCICIHLQLGDNSCKTAYSGETLNERKIFIHFLIKKTHFHFKPFLQGFLSPKRGTLCNRHRWALTLILMSAISDIRLWHLLFRYRKQICQTENCHSDIRSVPISTSESILMSKEKKLLIQLDSNPRPWKQFLRAILLSCGACLVS